MCFCALSSFCSLVIGIFSSLAVIVLRSRELVALLYVCCDCLCSFALPSDVVGLSAFCGCVVSWAYSLTFNAGYDFWYCVKEIQLLFVIFFFIFKKCVFFSF